MFNTYRRDSLRGALLIAVLVLAACAASPAPKVSCDSTLRPINPGSLRP